jgi:site-specific DNA-methyltransferase (adenine-specific)/modification methylase
VRQPDVVLDNGNIRLYCGDCLEILPTLEAGSVDAVVTDPPYGINFAGQPTKWQRRAGKTPVDWDKEAPDISWVTKIAKTCVVWGGNYFQLPPSRGWIVWTKPDAPPSMGNAELAWTSVDRTTRHITHSISATNKERVGHPTQKPVRVMEFSIETAKIGEDSTILDPFMGSGTTGVACVKTGRKFIGIELDRGYFDIAVKRIEKALKERDEQLIGANHATA